MKNTVGYALALLLIAACDPTSEDPVGFGDTCADVGFTKCGGDAVGDWSLKTSCNSWIGKDVKPFGEGKEACNGLTVTRELKATGGLMKLKADSSYEESLTVEGEMHGKVTEACFDALSSGAMTLAEACADLEASLKDNDDFFGMPIACSVTGTDCLCSGSATFNESVNGTYAVSGETITLTPANGDASTVDFCVKGSEIAFRNGEDLSVYRK